MTDDILARLLAAQNDEERQWITLEFSLQNQPELVRKAVWAAAVPHWFDGKFLEALLEQDSFETGPEYQALLKLSFIELYPERGYSVHERTRKLLLDRLHKNDPDKYKDFSQRAYQYLAQFTEPDTLLLAETYYHGIMAGLPEVIDEFINQGIEWHNHFDYNKIEVLISPVLEAASAKHLSGRAVAWAYYRQGRLDITYYRHKQARIALKQAIEQAEKELGLISKSILALGDVHRSLDEYVDARARYEEALPIYREVGDRLGEANCIQALGDVHGMMSENSAARSRYEEALPVYREIGNRLGEANCIKALGDVHGSLSEFSQARARYEEALLIYREVGDRLGEANCIQALGDVHAMLSENAAARACYEEALPIYREIGARLGEANCIKTLGDLYGELDENDMAVATLKEAAAQFKDLGQRASEASCYSSIGSIFSNQKKYNDALQAFDEAIKVFPDGYIFRNRVDVLIEMSQFDLAAAALEQAENIQPGQPYAALHRGRIALWRHDPLQAIEHFREAVNARPNNDVFHFLLAFGLLVNNQPDEAYQELHTALNLTYKVKDLEERLEDLDKLESEYGKNEAIGIARDKIKLAITQKKSNSN